MSPKGGIKPHNRFSIQAKRSEVLFVDYMAEHLSPNGRAGIIVPEGIMFQSQTAYKQLRKILVEDYLVAIVSLPAGVFNPYSGVKTSILILDKLLAKKSNTIGFFKVENDGFGLGAQRREISKNELPQAHAEIGEYLRRLRAGTSVEDFQPILGIIVEKGKLAANGEYNLSAERYRKISVKSSKYNWVTLGEITLDKPQYGSGARKVNYDGLVRYIRITDLTDRGDLKENDNDMVSPSQIEEDCFLQKGDLLIARSGSVGRTYLHQKKVGTFQFAGYLIRFRIDPVKALPAYVFQVTQSPHWDEWVLQHSKTGTITNINAQQYASFRLPLPPLEVQQVIVAEIEGYQRVIDGASAVLDNYRPYIPIHPDWPLVALGSLVEDMHQGINTAGLKIEFSDWGIPIIQSRNITSGVLDFKNIKYMSPDDWTTYRDKYKPQINDVLFTNIGTIGKSIIVSKDEDYLIHWNIFIIKTGAGLNPKYLKTYLDYLDGIQYFSNMQKGGTVQFVTKKQLSETLIALPSIENQQVIVAEIEAEQALVAANRELIVRFEKKIQTALASVWGEDKSELAVV